MYFVEQLLRYTYTMSDLTGTESLSRYPDLGGMPLPALLEAINREDATVAMAVKQALPQIEQLANAVGEQLRKGGRLFYIGAGTSGRLGILDASEILPTYGLDNTVIGLIAGGDAAIRHPVESAEDDPEQAWEDLQAKHISAHDILIGIAASGNTPYVLGGITAAKQQGIPTGCIVCNAHTPIAEAADYPVEVITGPEVVTGSTRMKAGTAQKMVLNMISTSAMIRLGRVQGSKMVEMQLTNNKLRNRAIHMLVQELEISAAEALELIRMHKTVKKGLVAYRSSKE